MFDAFNVVNLTNFDFDLVVRMAERIKRVAQTFGVWRTARVSVRGTRQLLIRRFFRRVDRRRRLVPPLELCDQPRKEHGGGLGRLVDLCHVFVDIPGKLVGEHELAESHDHGEMILEFVQQLRLTRLILGRIGPRARARDQC